MHSQKLPTWRTTPLDRSKEGWRVPIETVPRSERTSEGASMTGTGVPVELRGVTKAYLTAAGPVVALDRFDLEVAAGEFVTLLGPSGSGKTTALEIIAGLQEQTAGEVWLGAQEVGRLAPHKRDIGFVFQSYALFPHMTVAENVAFPLRLRKVARAECGKLVDDALRLVRLGGLAERRPAQLSGGQRQRVAVARAMVFHPRLLLMDEPLGALDKRLRDHMQLELRELQKRVGITCLYVTHDQEEAMLLSDRIAIMNDGRVQQVGSSSEIYRRPANEFVGDFVGRMNLWDGRVVDSDQAGSVVQLAPDLLVRCSQIAPAGTSVRLATRPESLSLVRRPPEDWDALPLQVRTVRFTGSTTLVHGVVGEALEVLVQVESTPLALEGDRGWVAVDPDAAFLFVQDQHGGQA
jgi:mannopine transport system ATP-binding protein